MKNRKFALTLALEENEELMNEIDGLLRERAKALVREEAEKLFDSTIQEEAERVAERIVSRLNDPNNSTRLMLQKTIRDNLELKTEWMKLLREEVNRFCECHAKNKVGDWVSSYVRASIDKMLHGVVQADVIKAVSDALTKR